MFCIMNGDSVHENGVDLPRIRLETTVADTEETSRGIIDVMEMLKRRISRVNSTPASGALKIPAMAPAAPHPSRIVMLL